MDQEEQEITPTINVPRQPNLAPAVQVASLPTAIQQPPSPTPQSNVASVPSPVLPPAQASAPTPTPTSGLDPSVVLMMKAIAETETPGGQMKAGQSGEIPSRFQYTPGTWAKVAGQFLGDPTAPVTPANENQATYMRIKQWKDQGMQPYQIAAMWNAGEGASNAWDPNAGYVGVHVNPDGSQVSYDTPQYVQKVMGNLKTLAQSQGNQTQQSNQLTQTNVQQGIAPSAQSSTAPVSMTAQQDRAQVIMDQNGGFKTIGENLTNSGHPILGALVGAAGNIGNFGEKIIDTAGVKPINTVMQSVVTAANANAVAGALNQGNAPLSAIDQKIRDEAHVYAATGNTKKAQQLLKILNAHGNPITLDTVMGNLPTTEQVIGSGIQGATAAAALMVGGEGGGEIAENTAGNFIQGAIKGAKLAIPFGATIGAGQGLGNAMANNEAPVPAALETVGGAAIGAVTAGLGGGILGGIASKVAGPTEEQAVDSLVNELNLNKSVMREYTPEQVRNNVEFAMQNGVNPELSSLDKTKWDTQTNMIPTLLQKEQPVEDKLQEVLQQFKGQPAIDLSVNGQPEIPAAPSSEAIPAKPRLGSIQERAYEIVNSDPTAAGIKLDQREAAVDAILKSESKRNGEIVDVPTANQIKRKMNFAYDPATEGAQKVAARAIRQAIREQTEAVTSAEIGSTAVHDLNQQLAKYEQAADFFDDLHGTTIKGGKLGAMLAKRTAQVVGAHVGGIPGALVAGKAEDMLNDIINNPETISVNAVKAYQKAAGYVDPNLKTLNDAQQFIQDLKLNRTMSGYRPPVSSRAQLPAPDNQTPAIPTVYGQHTIYMPPYTPQQGVTTMKINDLEDEKGIQIPNNQINSEPQQPVSAIDNGASPRKFIKNQKVHRTFFDTKLPIIEGQIVQKPTLPPNNIKYNSK